MNIRGRRTERKKRPAVTQLMVDPSEVDSFLHAYWRVFINQGSHLGGPYVRDSVILGPYQLGAPDFGKFPCSIPARVS